MDDVAALLEHGDMRLVSLPGLASKGDVVDFLQGVVTDWNGLEPIPEKHKEIALNALHSAVKDHAEPYKAPADQWDEPGAITHSLLPVPVLSEALIPEPYRVWISDVAYRMQTPPDFAAVTAITATASVVGTACTIRPKQKDDWTVIPNVWGAGIGRPTVVLKSPSMKEPMDMLEGLQKVAKAIHETQMRTYEFDKKLAEAKAKKFDDDLKSLVNSKKDGVAAEIDQMRDNFTNDDGIEEPVRRLYKTNETSIQSQTVLQTQNPRGILTYRDELTGLLTRWDRHEHEDERAYFLEGWNGNGSYTDYKIGRGLTEADNICISLFGGIQPDKLRRYLHQSMNGGNDGLMQRFQLAVYPDEPKNWKLIDKRPDTEARDKAFKALVSLDSLDYSRIAKKSEYGDLPYLRFTPKAQKVFNEWLTELQHTLPGEDNPLMAEHLGKYRSLMPSLALVFHLLDVADGTASGNVSKRAAILAAGWCEYLESHARRIYSFVTSPEKDAAVILSDRIKKLPNPFTAKDVYRKNWHLLKNRKQVEAACVVLIDENWLRKDSPRRAGGAGGRPALPQYSINPAVLEEK